MSDAYVGQPVLTKTDPRNNNGEEVAAGLVTRVKDDTVNVRVFLDTGADLRETGVKFVNSQPEDDDEDVNTNASGVQKVAWPVKA